MNEKIPFSEKNLYEWAGKRTFHQGKSLFSRGVVEKVVYEHPLVTGLLNLGPRGIRSRFKLLPSGLVDNLCPCRDSQDRGLICVHLVAMGLELLRLNADPGLEKQAAREVQRAKRIEEAPDRHRIRRVKKSEPGAVSAHLILELEQAWKSQLQAGNVGIRVFIDVAGERIAAADVSAKVPYYFSHRDENILYFIEELAGERLQNVLTLSTRNFIAFLRTHQSKSLFEEGRKDGYRVEKDNLHSIVYMDLDHINGELLLDIKTESTESSGLPLDETPIYIIGPSAGWIFCNERFWPLGELVPPRLREIYDGRVRIPRNQVPAFLMTELPQVEQFMVVRSDISADLFFMKPATPEFRLLLKGSPASLAAKLYARYNGGEIELVAGRADMRGNFAIPDPTDLLSYRTRNMTVEKQAVQRLEAVGFIGRAGDTLHNIDGPHEVLNFLGRGVPRIKRMGWQIELEGLVEPFFKTVEYVHSSVHIEESKAGDYFDVNYEYKIGTDSISSRDIQHALMEGNSFIEREGRTILLDADAILQALDVFKDCADGESDLFGSVRVRSVYSSYVQLSLNTLKDIGVEASASWLERAKQQNEQVTVSPVELSPHFKGTLRAYQHEGVNWLRFLEIRGFCGILADEMGLGKTIQTLAWIQLDRAVEAGKRRPALIVCPTSLVENWAEESARFTPNLKVLMLHGSDRHRRWKNVEKSDLVITSYALLRRDIEKHLAYNYSIAILDEAQHIKNRSTLNAVAAKKIRADHRLVLTGTPIENGVTDLWSIMDFLMPGYLGSHTYFREAYELPILNGGADAEYTQAKLRRKLHPFLLRRMKVEVARDLPPKIERIAPCKLTQDQHKVYTQILEGFRSRITGMVEKDGFNKVRMEVLQTLLRLRQVCCHIDLLKLKGVKSKHPSAKMELFFELLNEAIDGGHRVLVFSQFTSMLAILEEEMHARDLVYCYLDGSTKDRQSVVRRFNKETEIPLFLISLKAGGTGLNLTGADMVIHFDPWWNPAVEDQATDRAHRIGQKNTVYSVKLITRGTVEEKVLEMQQRKRAIIGATLMSDEQVMQKLTWEDVQELLSL